jgi:hypothetical protein
MNRGLIFLFTFFVVLQSLEATSQPRLLETTEEYRQRLSAERYDDHQRSLSANSFYVPFGSQREYLGRETPWGVETPGRVRQHRFDYEIPGYDPVYGTVNGQ